jgi:hypothetical protein
MKTIINGNDIIGNYNTPLVVDAKSMVSHYLVVLPFHLME